MNLSAFNPGNSRRKMGVKTPRISGPERSNDRKRSYEKREDYVQLRTTGGIGVGGA